MKTLNTIIKTNVRAQININHITPINLIGVRGIGKTSLIKQIVKDLNSTLLHVSIPAKNLEYFSGLPVFIDMENISKYSRSGSKNIQGTSWTAPEIIVQANSLAEKNGNCVLFLDDIHKLDESTSRVMYELLLERSIGDYKLNDNVAVVCAMNDSEENGFDGMESAIKGRLFFLKYNLNIEEWMLKFGNLLHPLIASFLKTQSKFILEDENTTIEQSASPRAWENLSKSFDLYDEKFIVENIETLSNTIMTEEATYEFTNHVKYMNKINLSKVVKKRDDIDFNSLKELDKILYAYIINYIKTADDAVYLITLINKISDKSMNNFIGFLSGEIANMYKKRDANNNSMLNTGQQIIIDKILDEYDASKYDLSQKEINNLNIDFNDKEMLIDVIGDYIL